MDFLTIACDEAGYTGADLLSKDQRIFAFASVAISDDEARELIREARSRFQVQMPELKASKLLGSNQGQRLMRAILQACDGKYKVTVHDKLLALCCQLFEYVFEPVLKDNPRIFYEKNLHRFVAMCVYVWLQANEAKAHGAIAEFQAYMRSRNPADAPFLFDRHPVGPKGDATIGDPFDSILQFARGYRDVIIADNADLGVVLPDQGRWLLDLSATSLWTHLNIWGRSGNPLSVWCDSSKPLNAQASRFTGDQNDAGIHRARIMGRKEPLGFKLIHPVVFVDSKDHPMIEVADIIAGAAAASCQGKLMPECADVVDMIEKHLGEESILPDYDVVDSKKREAMINSVILFGLASRAAEQANPHDYIAEIYRLAEEAWDKGELKPGD